MGLVIGEVWLRGGKSRRSFENSSKAPFYNNNNIQAFLNLLVGICKEYWVKLMTT